MKCIAEKRRPVLNARSVLWLFPPPPPPLLLLSLLEKFVQEKAKLVQNLSCEIGCPSIVFLQPVNKMHCSIIKKKRGVYGVVHKWRHHKLLSMQKNAPPPIVINCYNLAYLLPPYGIHFTTYRINFSVVLSSFGISLPTFTSTVIIRQPPPP